MYLKNIAGQHYTFGLVRADPIGPLTGATVTGLRVLDGGVQAPISGSFTEKGSGQYDLAFSQDDVNAESGGYLLLASGAIPYSFNIAFFSIYDGIARDGGTTSVQLDASCSTVANSYVNWRIAFIDVSGNVGRGQARTVVSFDQTTGWATVDRAWDSPGPTNGSMYVWSTPADVPSTVRNSIADSVLLRDVANVEATAAEHTLCTSVLAGLEWDISSTTWNIRRTNGSTLHYAKVLTPGSGLNSVTGVQ